MGKSKTLSSVIIENHAISRCCKSQLVAGSQSEYYQVIHKGESVTKFIKHCEDCGKLNYYYLDITMDEEIRFVGDEDSEEVIDETVDNDQ